MKLSEIEVFIIYRYECRAYTVNYYRRITHNTKLRFTIYRKKCFQKLFNPRRSISYDIYNRVTHPLLLLLLRFASKDTHERIRTSERKSKFNEHVSLPVRDYAKRTRTRNAKFKKVLLLLTAIPSHIGFVNCVPARGLYTHLSILLYTFKLRASR